MKKIVQSRVNENSGNFLLRNLFVTALLWVFAVAAYAQSGTLKGVVTDNSGAPIIGASVVIDGTTKGVSTDGTGKYTLQGVTSASKIKVMFLGYVTQTIAVGSRSQINVVLAEDNQVIEQLVVIGYGSVKKSALTSAVASMDAASIIEARPMARPEIALQGQLAGVSVRATTGEPGADIGITVRGAASVNAGSSPLYVIDGVPTSSMNGLNPQDIDRIEVLKDAASSAIYGSRGSNGVIMVTTKKGSKGKAQISVNIVTGVQALEKKMDLLSAEEWMKFRIKFNDASYLIAAAAKSVPASIKDSNADRLSKLGLTSPNYNYINDERWFNYMDEKTKSQHTYTPNDQKLDLLDWQDEFYRLAPIQDYNVNVSGGSENSTYMFSMGYLNQEGIATGTGFQRLSLRTNVESKLSKFVTAGIQIAPTISLIQGAGRANGKDTQTHYVLASTPVSEPGVGYNTNLNGNAKYLWAGSTSSPVYTMNTNIREDETIRGIGNAYLRLTPLEGLRVELSGSSTLYDLDGRTYSFSSASANWADGEGQNSSGGHNTERTWSTLLQSFANYDRSFGKHDFGLMLGASREQLTLGYTTNQTYNKPFFNDAINYSFDGSKVAVGTDVVTQQTPKNLVSAFGRIQYSYDGRYMFTASLRDDAASVFGKDNKWGLFPAVSGGWLVSNEKFFQSFDIKWLNSLKLRASYGVTGNNSIATTAAYPTMAQSSYDGQSGYTLNTAGNPNLGWEKSHSTDLAIDIGLFQNRVQLSVDYYTKKTVDMLYNTPTLGASGFTTRWENLGGLNNQGIEIELNTVNVKTTSLSWNTSFNMSYNKNEVTSLGSEDTPVFSGFDNNNPSNILTVGRAINTFYMYDAIGVWKNQKEIDDFSKAHNNKPVLFEGKKIVPGDIRYRDVDNSGSFDKSDKDYLGSPNPTFIFGMTNNFAYKNFDLSILITAQQGGKIYGVIGRAIDRPSMGALSNVMGNWRNAWWSEDEPGDGKVPYILSSTTGTTLDSRWLYSSDYLRIKNITLGYKIPFAKANNTFARVFVSIENLKKWDKYYGGYSPEASNSTAATMPGGAGGAGIDYSGYPLARTFSVGATINF